MNAAVHDFPKDPADALRAQRRQVRIDRDIAENELEVALSDDGAGDADLIVTDLRNLADEVAETLSAWIERLAKLDPRILEDGGRLTTADTHDWHSQLVEFFTGPMTPLAARAFGLAVKAKVS